MGIGGIKLRKRLMEDPNLNLEKAIRICQASEVTEARWKQLERNGYTEPLDRITTPLSYRKLATETT